MSVARRAVIGFTVVLVIAMSACAFVFVQAGIARGRLADYRSGAREVETSMASVRADFYAYDDQMNMYVAVLAGGGHAQHKLAEEAFQQAVDARIRLDAELASVRPLIKDATLRTQLDRIVKDVAAYGEFADKTRSAGMNWDVPTALKVQTVDNLPPSEDIMPALDEASKIVRSVVNAELKELDRQQAQVQEFTAVGGTMLALVIGFLAFGMRRWIVRPVSVLQATIAGIASGERSRSERLRVHGRDEFSKLSACFNTMLDSLDQQDAELQLAIDVREHHMQESFEQQRAAEQMVRARAQSVVDETAATVRADLEELMAAVQVVREAADTIDSKVGSADTVTQGVVGNARRAEQVVSELEASLRRVAGMTELIAGVADQTKLLALNATIEAARAGEAGRGFSVVADEVKQLATTTATSTNEIVATIASLERDAGAMTSAISSMSVALGGVDEATGALKEVAAAQHALVQRLDSKVIETIAKVDGMATLADRLERRQHPRVPLTGTVRLRGPNGVLEGEFGDLSEGGLLCVCSRPAELRPGTLVDVDFEVDGQRFSQRCQVVMAPVMKENEVRLQFLNAAPALIKAARRLTGDASEPVDRRSPATV